MPNLLPRVKLYTKDYPILEEYGVQAEIDKALRSKVWLKSGGYLVINQTEALVAIDVNTGRYVGKRTGRLEDTIVKTNLEAVKEIVRQLRLRDLGGIIVLDLIDMEEKKNRQKVFQEVEKELRKDRSPSKAIQVSDFGLVIVTRKRVKQSLERQLTEPCPYCSGSGSIKSSSTICYEIMTELKKIGVGARRAGSHRPGQPGHRARAQGRGAGAAAGPAAVAGEAGDDQAGRAPASRAVRRDGDVGGLRSTRTARARNFSCASMAASLSPVIDAQLKLRALLSAPSLVPRGCARRRQVDQVVVPALVEPHPDVVVALERLHLRAVGGRRRVLDDHLDLRLRDDADDFAGLDGAALHELDPALERLGDAHGGRPASCAVRRT